MGVLRHIYCMSLFHSSHHRFVRLITAVRNLT